MELVFLGTGTSQGVPVITCNCSTCLSDDLRDKRLRTSALIHVDNKNIVIDAGPDFRQQMLREKIKYVDAILITHEHKDHVAGLDDIRPFNFKRKKAMDIFIEERVEASLRREFAYVFEKDAYPGVPQMNLVKVLDKKFLVSEIEVIPIRVMHMDLPILGYRIGDLTYITDASFIDKIEIEKIMGSKVLVINALMKEKHYSHFNLQKALDLIKHVNPERGYLTHISHVMGKYADIESEIPENVYFAYDGLRVTI